MKPSFPVVGRAGLLEAVSATIDGGFATVVTLLGPAGIGKTAVAREIARARGALWVAWGDAEDEAAAIDRILAAAGASVGMLEGDERTKAAALLAERAPGVVVLDGARAGF